VSSNDCDVRINQVSAVSLYPNGLSCASSVTVGPSTSMERVRMNSAARLVPSRMQTEHLKEQDLLMRRE
jgi:hypothetical protein